VPWYVELARGIVGTMVIFSGVAVVAAMFGVLLERKISGWIQSRLGPKHVGPQGLLQTIADTIKLLQKENIVPRNADKAIFAAAVVVVPLAALRDYVVIRFGTTRTGSLIFRDLNIGVLYFAATSALVVVGILMAGWGSNNKYALLGGLRSAAQMVSYEIPMGLALIAVALLAGSLSTVTIVNAQRTVWFGVVQPVPFLIFLIAATVEMNRVPFDLVEAESELVAGLFLRV
jgi:NADH-quinone oxidoreductase subunit H